MLGRSFVRVVFYGKLEMVVEKGDVVVVVISVVAGAVADSDGAETMSVLVLD